MYDKKNYVFIMFVYNGMKLKRLSPLDMAGGGGVKM